MRYALCVHDRCLGSFILLSLLASVILLAGCGSSAQTMTPAGALPPPPVSFITVQTEDAPIYSEFAAQTYSRHQVEVRGRVEGYVEKWLFDPGQNVTAGQVLYILDLRPYRAALEQAGGNLKQAAANQSFAQRQVALLQAEANLAAAQAQLVKAQQDVKRLRPLVVQDAAAQQDLDAATAALSAAEATVRANQANVEQTRLSTATQIDAAGGQVETSRGALHTAELNLEYATIRAPISGRIGDTLVPVGGLVSPNSAQPLTTIVPLDPIWVRFQVSEAEFLDFVSGRHRTLNKLPVELTLTGGRVLPHRGEIADALNQVDPKTGTLELQASFPNPDHIVLPGQFGHIRIRISERKGAILVPQKAVQEIQNVQSVYTLSPANQVQARAVVTGDRAGDRWIIEQGLKPGDRVIVDGSMKVRPGMVVAPKAYTESEPRG